MVFKLRVFYSKFCLLLFWKKFFLSQWGIWIGFFQVYSCCWRFWNLYFFTYFSVYDICWFSYFFGCWIKYFCWCGNNFTLICIIVITVNVNIFRCNNRVKLLRISSIFFRLSLNFFWVTSYLISIDLICIYSIMTCVAPEANSWPWFSMFIY